MYPIDFLCAGGWGVPKSLAWMMMSKEKDR